MALEQVEAMRKADITPLPSVEVFGRLLCRLIQLIKLHRDVAFAAPSVEKLCPSSILITTLATRSYQMKAQVPHFDQLDLLLDIIRTMPTLIQTRPLGNNHVEWIVDNPTAPGDNLAASVDSRAKQDALLQWHGKLIEDIVDIMDATERRAGLDQVAHKVSSSFGDKAGAALRQAQLTRQNQHRSAGRVTSFTNAGIVLPMSARGHTFFGG
jgi:hypothetical protein